MKNFGKLILALIIVLIIVLSDVAASNRVNHLQAHTQEQIDYINASVANIAGDIEKLSAGSAEQQENITAIQDKIDELAQSIEDVRREPGISRAGGRSRTMRVTAYDLSSCHKLSSNPQYGITASGERVREWYTIAAGPDIPFGTRIYIPHFRDCPNSGWFVVQDRGPAIRNSCLDIYMKSYDDCIKFGVRELEVYICDEAG